MTDLVSAVTAYLTARTDADSAPPWARIMREDVAGSRMRELLAACFAADVSLDGALVLHAPDYVRGEAERWGSMVARIAPPAPVVLRPWQASVSKDGRRLRYPVGDNSPWPNASAAVGTTKTLAWSQTDEVVFRSEKTGQDGQDAVDEWMRAQGWVLLDSEPLPEPAILEPWATGNAGARFRSARKRGVLFCAVFVDADGWRVVTRGALYPEDDMRNFAAHGPQTGAEGERLAMVAALALGFVEGA